MSVSVSDFDKNCEFWKYEMFFLFFVIYICIYDLGVLFIIYGLILFNKLNIKD